MQSPLQGGIEGLVQEVPLQIGSGSTEVTGWDNSSDLSDEPLTDCTSQPATVTSDMCSAEVPDSLILSSAKAFENALEDKCQNGDPLSCGMTISPITNNESQIIDNSPTLSSSRAPAHSLGQVGVPELECSPGQVSCVSPASRQAVSELEITTPRCKYGSHMYMFILLQIGVVIFSLHVCSGR